MHLAVGIGEYRVGAQGCRSGDHAPGDLLSGLRHVAGIAQFDHDRLRTGRAGQTGLAVAGNDQGVIDVLAGANGELHLLQCDIVGDQLRGNPARAVGEGHISTIEFRTGILTSQEILIEESSLHLVTAKEIPSTMSTDFLRAYYAELGNTTSADFVINLLPEKFDSSHLDSAIATVMKDELTQIGAQEVIRDIKWLAPCSYRVEFMHDRPLKDRILFPTSVDETHGMEDARFIKFIEDDGQVMYYATYTAYDGLRVKPHLLQTSDFQTFEITRLIGPASKNKGMALFPRKVKGKYLALSRWDRESISVATSLDTKTWSDAVEICIPEQPWEFIQLGNCGSPIETPDGWLVITHGVGPMREYGIGVALLDLEDPTQLISTLSQPLLTAENEERDGYTPNVVYSCGALIHENTLVLPYGYSDEAIRFAMIDMPELMNQLRTSL